MPLLEVRSIRQSYDRRPVLDALSKMTGADFGFNKAAWRTWYAQEKIAAGLELPSGYAVEFGGQFKNLIEAKRRLMVVVPVALALILILIWFTFRSVRQTLLISLCVPALGSSSDRGSFIRKARSN